MTVAPPLSRRSEIVLIAALVALGTVMRLALFNGLYGHDDWAYLYYIRSFMNGQTDELLHAPLGLRFGVWFPIAVTYKLFGVSYWGTFLPGFLCGLATVPLTYVCIRKLGWSAAVAVVGCLALLFNPIDWMVASTLRGDIEMSFYSGVLLLLLLYFRELRGRPQLVAGVVLGCAWGLAALTKEWGFVFAWGFFAVAIFDAIRLRRVPWEYAMVGVGFFAALAADTIFLHAVTGDWQTRFKTSFSWYQNLGTQDGYLGDRSTEFSYLPSLIAGLRNPLTESGRFDNGYPYYGIYMWLLVGALPLCLVLRGPARAVAWFVTGILLWIEFGSMSWAQYLIFHKEPRYLAIISVPAATLMASAGAQLWDSRSRWVQAGLVAAAATVAVVTFRVVQDENREYTHGRDFVPALIAWLGDHPQARIWASSSFQNEIDLRFGYRFADPAHRHAGTPGFGTVTDLGFWRDFREAGDYVLVSESWLSFHDRYPMYRDSSIEPTPVAVLRGPTSTGTIYRARGRDMAEKGTGYLSEWDPDEISQSYGNLHFDQNVSGTPLLLGGIHYAKGLGTHADSNLMYRINGRFSLFSAIIGVDDTEGGGGSVVFEVWLDKQRVYQSKVIRGGSPPESIQIDVTGAMILRLIVTNGGDDNHGDHADWAEAKLIQKPTN